MGRDIQINHNGREFDATVTLPPISKHSTLSNAVFFSRSNATDMPEPIHILVTMQPNS